MVPSSSVDVASALGGICLFQSEGKPGDVFCNISTSKKKKKLRLAML